MKQIIKKLSKATGKTMKGIVGDTNWLVQVGAGFYGFNSALKGDWKGIGKAAAIIVGAKWIGNLSDEFNDEKDEVQDPQPVENNEG